MLFLPPRLPYPFRPLRHHEFVPAILPSFCSCAVGILGGLSRGEIAEGHRECIAAIAQGVKGLVVREEAGGKNVGTGGGVSKLRGEGLESKSSSQILDDIRAEDCHDLWASYLEAVKHEKMTSNLTNVLQDLQFDYLLGVLRKLEEVVALRLRHLR